MAHSVHAEVALYDCVHVACAPSFTRLVTRLKCDLSTTRVRQGNMQGNRQLLDRFTSRASPTVLISRAEASILL
jgi:hypothetical protein